MMTFTGESRKVNVRNKKTYEELELVLNKYYYMQNKIVSEYESYRYYKRDIVKHLVKNKLDEIRNNILTYGKEHSRLIEDYQTMIQDIIISNITAKEISDAKILKKAHDQNNRIEGEKKLARSLEKELSSDYWREKFKNEKEIIMFLDNAPIHIATLTKKLAKYLNITLIYLPKYASDLNSIERLWYMIKHELSIDYIEDENYLKEQFELFFYEFTQTDSLAKKFISDFII